MHSSHKILVNIKVKDNNISSPEEVIAIAEAFTVGYYNKVFDWREVEKVLFAEEDPEKFISELKQVLEYQNDFIMSLVDIIKKETQSSDIEDIVKKRTSNTGYNLSLLGDLIAGYYTFDSLFYDTQDDTSIVDIDKVMESPNEWALVIFDYHY